jgi:hypothetical protein
LGYVGLQNFCFPETFCAVKGATGKRGYRRPQSRLAALRSLICCLLKWVLLLLRFSPRLIPIDAGASWAAHLGLTNSRGPSVFATRAMKLTGGLVQIWL